MRSLLVAFAILALIPFLKSLMRGALLQAVSRIFGRALGADALARQPDEIHLTSAGAEAWKDGAAARAIAAPLLEHGFQDGGSYKIQEMPVTVRLFAHPGDCLYAAIYEHPQVGVWFDIVTRLANGESITFTTSRPSGLDQRPGHPTVHVPGAAPLTLLSRACAGRPRGVYQPATVGAAARFFEQAYAESIAWRKTRGVSASEVAQVARRKAA